MKKNAAIVPEIRAGGRKSIDPKRAVTLRIGEGLASRISAIAEANRITDSDVYRFMVEAGVALAERDGLGAVMEVRREWFRLNPLD